MMRLSWLLRRSFDFGEREVAHWFPGHMAKGLKQMKTKLKNIDCIVEIHDARISFMIKRILAQLKQQGVGKVIFTNCLKDQNIKQVVPAISELIGCSQRFHREESTETCIMVIGVPNVGKSSLINALRRTHLRKGKASKVGAEPGITRSVLTKIQVAESPLLFLLDTPGVLSPRIESVETGMKLALCGTILDHLVGEDILADYLLYILNEQMQHRYVEHYGLEKPCADIETLLKRIALKLGKTQKVKAITGVGDVNITVPNYNAAAYDFIRTFRRGQLGVVMLD
ncbi:mitochondrial ribosome-associated GTPase 1 isoform X2 [Xenopus laevis]|uniref:Mitochondrial GTPase 1 n=1 Tax=Xenopus laevis TaxID=8355 RepID=A0A8J1L689_XENLA|nr:mitochondrial ribosome-associated GTPase 1 isoform X2 [Xenopus laevis]